MKETKCLHQQCHNFITKPILLCPPTDGGPLHQWDVEREYKDSVRTSWRAAQLSSYRGLVDKENNHLFGEAATGIGWQRKQPPRGLAYERVLSALSRNYYTKIISVSSISALVDQKRRPSHRGDQYFKNRNIYKYSWRTQGSGPTVYYKHSQSSVGDRCPVPQSKC